MLIIVFGISFASIILLLPYLDQSVTTLARESISVSNFFSSKSQPTAYASIMSPIPFLQQQIAKGHNDDLSASAPSTHFKQESPSAAVVVESAKQQKESLTLEAKKSSQDEITTNDSASSTIAPSQMVEEEPARFEVTNYQSNKTKTISLVIPSSDGTTKKTLWQQNILDRSETPKMIPDTSVIKKNTINLRTDNGTVLAIQDDSQYIQPSLFSQLSSQIYDMADHDDEKFLYDVWYLLSHSIEYSVEPDPLAIKPPLQTLTESKGDCEDLAILTASIIAALPEAKQWSVQLVYFNASDATHANSVNHVALFVNTGKLSTFVETTASEKSDGLTVWKQVRGWYVDIPQKFKQ